MGYGATSLAPSYLCIVGTLFTMLLCARLDRSMFRSKLPYASLACKLDTALHGVPTPGGGVAGPGSFTPTPPPPPPPPHPGNWH